MPPEASVTSQAVVMAFLTRVARRRQVADAARATSAGFFSAAAVVVIAAVRGHRPSSAWMAIVLAALLTAGVMLWRARGRWSPEVVASFAERGIPESHNVIFTARELIATAAASAPWMQRRVLDRAASIVERANVPAMVPVGRDILSLGIAAAVLAAIAVGVPPLPTRTRTGQMASADRIAAGGLGPWHVMATVMSPPYTGITARTVSDPDALDVVHGGRISLAVAGSGRWSVRFGAQPLPSTPAGVEIAPQESGYFAIERQDAEGGRRLVPVTVTPDRAPTVRIDRPGKDLLMTAARDSIAVASSAIDDFGLQSLELRYTRVTGSGERFEFVEGVLPISITRESGRSWKATGSFDLTRLGLEPGDSLVYRAVARDGRPGPGGVATSDTFFIEIAAPGQVALPGFELPPDRERYALSQQMIVLKLQRLRARQASLAREALAEETNALAAEQRAVRANFIFLMGGQVEDEEAEAEQSSEIQEGRLENNAHREINSAIHFMGQAEQSLVGVDTGAALPPAKSAVDALQRAFGHNRYFLRTLAVRSRLDPSRRLTGDLKEASGWHRSLEAPTGEATAARARLLLARLLALAPGEGLPPATASSAIGALAEEALAVDPGSADWRRISAALTTLRDDLASGRSAGDVRRAVREAVAPLMAMSRKRSVGPGAGSDLPDKLRSAWTDEARVR
jgi:hypothetical protein